MDIRKKIMVVDDEIENQRLFSGILTSEQYVVSIASNGIECLKLAEEENPDLILLDVNMPEMDGFETIKHLRLMKKYKYTPIVFLTGFGTSPDNIEFGYALGSNEYWTKPISADELVVRVRSVLHIAETEKQLRKLQQSFYSMLVHDLRNPIGAILGFSELLLDEKESLNDEQIEMISGINESSASILQIVKDFLELSQFESGEYMLRKSSLSLNDLINSVVNKMSVIQHQKNIEIEIHVDELPALHADPYYLNETIENILDNALRFTPNNGKISITAKLNKDAHEKDVVVVEFSDTGAGIDENEIPTLFDKNKKATRRSGLGLPICKEIIEAHGGTIRVDTKKGIGSTFIISLPL